MSSTTMIVLAVIVVIALILLLLVRGRKQHVTFGDAAPLPRAAAPAPTPVPATPPTMPAAEEHGVATEIADAIEDVVDQFIGLKSHPTGGVAAATGDTLTRLKGLGPKAAALLGELGVTTFAQIASWDEADVAAIDARMGAFKGRIVRDRWVEQARLLARGDTDAFETEFGKLGG